MQEKKSLSDVLRQHGLRATAPRLTLLSIMEKAVKPQSVKTLQDMLKREMDGVTVYRTLETLLKAGIVARIDLGHSHTHYELVAGRKHHHHLVCNSCGTIEDISYCPSLEIEQKALKNSRQFTSVQRHALELFGTCIKCA